MIFRWPKSRKKFFLLVALVGLICAGGLAGYKACVMYQAYFGVPDRLFHVNADLSDLWDDTISHYYVHANGKNALAVESGAYATPPFDDNGIPWVDYQGRTGKQYNPVTIAQYGLENWELFLQSGQQKHREVFLKQADWLVKHQEEGKWHYHFAVKPRELEAPWISGMAQGEGISVLLRAWQSTGKAEYLTAARKAFAVLQTPVDQGGASYKAQTGTWIEEYPNPSAPSHVLNGHVWALFGVWDLWRVTKSPDAQQLFDDGTAALKADLGKYDTGYWVLYEQSSRHLVGSSYMHSQIEQLRVLHALTEEKDSVFSSYAAKWEGYYQNKGNLLRIIGHRVRDQVAP